MANIARPVPGLTLGFTWRSMATTRLPCSSFFGNPFTLAGWIWVQYPRCYWQPVFNDASES